MAVTDVLNIPHEFGGQTVGFVTVTNTGNPGYLGVTTEQRTAVLMHGVRFRPLSTEESAGLTSELKGVTTVAGELWKFTGAAEAAALAADSTGEIVYDGTNSPQLDDNNKGNRFRIEGFNQPKPDMYGTVHHVTIVCQRQAS